MPRDPIISLINRLEEKGDLPTLPQIVIRLNTVADNPRSSAADLANIILHDQALTSQVLRIANSVFYSGIAERRVATVTQAVVVLGFQAVVRLAMGVSVFNMLGGKERGDHLLRIWIHSVACAVASQRLARLGRLENLEEAFVAGLIHDVGKLVLLRCVPDEYQRIAARQDEGESSLEAERAVLGVTHTELGGELAKRWNLPNTLVRSIAHHHTFGDTRDHFHNTIVLANQIAMIHYSAQGGEIPVTLVGLEHMASAHCGLPRQALQSTLDTLRDGVEECLAIFGVDEAREASRLEELSGESRQARERLHDVFAQMQSEIHRKNAQIAMLQQVTTGVLQGTDASHMIPMILEGLFLSLNLTRVVLALRCPGGVAPEMGFGAELERVMPLLRLSEAEHRDHPIFEVLRTGQPMNIIDTRSPIQGGALTAWGWPARALAIIPILREGKIEGVLIADRGGGPLIDEDLEAMALFGNSVSLVLTRSG